MDREGLPNHNPETSETSDSLKLQWTVWKYLFGELPVDCYRPDRQSEVQAFGGDVERIPVLKVEKTAEEVRDFLITTLAGASEGVYLARTLNKPKEDWVKEGVFPETYTRWFRENIKAALPLAAYLEEDPHRAFTAFSEAQPEGTFPALFPELFEERFALSQIIPLNGKGSRLPYGALRDFVLSVLPRTLPVKKSSLHFPGREESAKRAELELHRLQERAGRMLGEDGPRFSAALSTSRAAGGAPSFVHSLRRPEPGEATPVREIEWTHQSVRRLCPSLFPRLENAPGAAGKDLAKRLRAVPPLDAEDLREWCALNGLDAAENEALAEYLLEQRPRDPAALDRLMYHLMTRAGELKLTEGALALRPALTWDSARPVDPRTAALIQRLAGEDRRPSQVLFIEVQDQHHSLEKQLEGFLARAQAGELKVDSKEWREAQRCGIQVGKYSDPAHSLPLFAGFLTQGWGSAETCMSLAEDLAKERKKGSMASLESQKLDVLLLLTPGILEATSKVLSRGVDAKGALAREALTGSLLAQHLQLYLRHSIGPTGVPNEDAMARQVLPMNDLLLLVLTDFHYYSRNENGLKSAYQRYGKIVGKDLAFAPPEYQMLPVHLYCAAKFAYLRKDWGNTIKFVSTVADRDQEESHLQTIVNKLRTYAEADSAEAPDRWRADGQGLRGYAPLQVSSERFLQEMIRIGVMAINILSSETPAEAARYDALRTQLVDQFYRLKGPLSPVQIMNFHIAEARLARDKAQFDQARLMLDRAWEAIGDEEVGYNRRTIEHHTVECDMAELDATLQSPAMPAKEPPLLTALRAVVVEHTLAEEERRDSGTAQKVWEYQASFFEALLSYAQLLEPRIENAALDPQLLVVERRGAQPFAFTQFTQRSLETWISDASAASIEACRVLAQESPSKAAWACGYIFDQLQSFTASAPLLEQWRALVQELSPEKP